MPKPEWNPPSAPEAQARAQIDEQLIAAGWIIQNYKALNLGAGQGIALREVPLKTGPCDYLLLVDRRPIGVIEAKKMGTTLSGVADQSANYAENLPDFLAKLLPAGIAGLPFLYESTGVETLFRDERDPEPRSRRVFTFHRPETFAGWLVEPDTLRARLAAMPIAHPLPAQNLRDCQIEGITHLEESFTAARPRALIQMATGAGKTYTACSFTYRLIKHGGAKRVLFLVDRANLGRQAMAEFQHFVAPDTGRKFTEVYNVQHLTSNQLDSVARVTICTIQRLYSLLRGEELDEDVDEKSGYEIATADDRPKDVAYNPRISSILQWHGGHPSWQHPFRRQILLHLAHYRLFIPRTLVSTILRSTMKKDGPRRSTNLCAPRGRPPKNPDWIALYYSLHELEIYGCPAGATGQRPELSKH
jgi:type I restriction enzyme R subunit